VRAARLAAAETALDSTINAAILGYALAGNIHGPTDPEHPNQLRLPDGAWFDYRALGPLALRLSLISSVVDAGADEANKLNPNVLRAGLNASAQMLSKEWYTMGILDLLMAMGQGRFAEGASRFITQKGDMLTPVGAALNEIEKIRDPLMRDPTQNLPAALWERQQSRIPGLAEMLPPRVSTTTGEPLRRPQQGPLEAILGITSEPSDPQKAELARLERLGYSLRPPNERTDTVTMLGSEIPLSDSERRTYLGARGRFLATLGTAMADPDYQQRSDDEKATFWRNVLERSARAGELALAAQWGEDELNRRLAAGKRVVGRLEPMPGIPTPGPIQRVSPARVAPSRATAERVPAPTRQPAPAR